MIRIVNKRLPKDLGGRKLGRLVIIAKTRSVKNGRSFWLCRCDCGNEKRIPSMTLRNGSARSCGCLSKEMLSKNHYRRIDLTGRVFGRLTVKKYNDTVGKERKRARWLCQCDCGKTCVIRANNLLRGNTKSCGCLHDDVKGEKNLAWKGGVTLEAFRIRMSIEYRLWRESVFARDNWTCVDCGKRGVTLNAHHIKTFSLFPDLRFAIDNGETLCVKCHRKKKARNNVKR